MILCNVNEKGTMLKNTLSSGIYAIINNINNKRYIGLSKNIERRLNTHMKQLEDGKHPNFHLQKSYNKYGKENFDFSVIEYCVAGKLQSREIYWITYFDSIRNGYNFLYGGKDEYSKIVHLKKNGFPPMILVKEEYNNLDENFDSYCKIVFDIGIEDILKLKNKTYKQKIIIKKYKDKKKKLERLLNGDFSKFKDKRKLNGLIDYEYYFYGDDSLLSQCAIPYMVKKYGL